MLKTLISVSFLFGGDYVINRKIGIVFMLLIFCLSYTSCICYGVGTENGYSSGKTGMISVTNARGSISLWADKNNCTEGDKLKFRVVEESAVPSFTGRSKAHNRTATYYYDRICDYTIFFPDNNYNSSSVSKTFYSAGEFSVYCRATFRWSTTSGKVNQGFPKYYYKTVYSNKINIKVKPVKVNHCPEIIATYTKINGNISESPIYNNTDGIRFCAKIKDEDGDYIKVNSGPIKIDGNNGYGEISYSSFQSRTGKEKSRGDYSNPRRGTWSLNWRASDEKLQSFKKYQKIVKNRPPVITSASLTSKIIDEQQGTTVFCTVSDPDRDKISSLRMFVEDSQGNRIYPKTANYKTIASSYSSGTQKSISLSPSNFNNKEGNYYINLYAVDGFDDVTKSNIKTIGVTFKGGSNYPKIIDTYTKIEGRISNAPLYNNTTGIEYCAKVKGNCKTITSGPVLLNGNKKFGKLAHDSINSSLAVEKKRGKYNNPQRGTWSLDWNVSDGKRKDTAHYSRQVKNRDPIIIYASVMPERIKVEDDIYFNVTCIDPDGDDIKKLTIKVTDNKGKVVIPEYIMASGFKSGKQQTTKVMASRLGKGSYVASFYGYDDFDSSRSLRKDVVFSIEKTTQIIPNPPEINIEENENNRLLGKVYHTELWDKNRRNFNNFYFNQYGNFDVSYSQYLAKQKPRLRGENVFWSGEKFLIEGKVNESNKTKMLNVRILGTDYCENLEFSNSHWHGAIFNPNMIGLWGKTKPEQITFEFTAYGKEVIVDKVNIIVDDTVKYWDLHRKE